MAATEPVPQPPAASASPRPAQHQSGTSSPPAESRAQVSPVHHTPAPPSSARTATATSKQLTDAIVMFQNRISKMKTESGRLESEFHHAQRGVARLERSVQNFSQKEQRRLKRDNQRRSAVSANHELVVSIRDQTRTAVAAARERARGEKRAQVAELHRLQEIFQCQANIIKANERERQLDLYHRIREQELSHGTRRERMAARKIQAVRDDRQREMELESAERQEKDALLAALESQERELRDQVFRMRSSRDEALSKLDELRSTSSSRRSPPTTERRVHSPPHLPPI